MTRPSSLVAFVFFVCSLPVTADAQTREAAAAHVYLRTQRDRGAMNTAEGVLASSPAEPVWSEAFRAALLDELAADSAAVEAPSVRCAHFPRATIDGRELDVASAVEPYQQALPVLAAALERSDLAREPRVFNAALRVLRRLGAEDVALPARAPRAARAACIASSNAAQNALRARLRAALCAAAHGTPTCRAASLAPRAA